MRSFSAGQELDRAPRVRAAGLAANPHAACRRSAPSNSRLPMHASIRRSVFSVVSICLALSGAATRAQPWRPPEESQRVPSKWGAGDQRGAANHMKPETVLRAARLIRTGQVFELGRRLEEGMPLQTTRDSSAHPRLGLTEYELVDPVGIVRDVQPGPRTDLDDTAAGTAQERAPPTAHARHLAQPYKRVVHQGHNPQPRRRRRARLKFGAGNVCHAANVRAVAPRAHR